MKKIFLILIFALLISGGIVACSYSSMVIKSPDIPAKKVETFSCEPYNEEKLLTLINSERSKVGAGPVVIDAGLDSIAENRAVQLNGKMDNHVGFRNLLNSYAFSKDYYFVGENLAGDESFGCSAPTSYINGWMLSDGHRETLINPRYEKIGIGYYKGVVDSIYGDLR